MSIAKASTFLQKPQKFTFPTQLKPESNPSTKSPKARENVTVDYDKAYLTTLETTEKTTKRGKRRRMQRANKNRPTACRQEQRTNQDRLLSTSNTNGVCRKTPVAVNPNRQKFTKILQSSQRQPAENQSSAGNSTNSSMP